MVSSKLEATHVRTNTNFLKTKSDSTLTTHFSFVMSDDASHSATVTATRAFINRSEHEFKLTKTVGLGSEGLILESDSLGALITVHADTTENWTLLKISMIDANGHSSPIRRIDLLAVRDDERESTMASIHPNSGTTRPVQRREIAKRRISARMTPGNRK